VTDTQPDTAQQQEAHYAASLGCSRATKIRRLRSPIRGCFASNTALTAHYVPTCVRLRSTVHVNKTSATAHRQLYLACLPLHGARSNLLHFSWYSCDDCLVRTQKELDILH